MPKPLENSRPGWIPEDEGPDAALVALCHAALSVLPPNCAFSHLTALRLLALPTSYAMDARTELHVVRPISRNRVRLPGVVGHRALHPRAVVDVLGLPVVDLADTWADLGELAGRGGCVGVDDLVVIGDACATRLDDRMPLLQAELRRNRPRGKMALVEAYQEVRVGSRSPRETLARLVLTRGGLPEPRLNHPVHASWDPDVLLGVGDLVWCMPTPDGRVIKVVGEYQGERYHSGDLRREQDARRAAGFRDDGWDVQDMWNADLNESRSRRTTLRRFAAALGVPEAELQMDAVEPRFFSRHAMDLAVQRDMRRSARR